jgi:hypothetical protein
MNDQTNSPGFSTFLPVAMLAISILIYVGWNLSAVVNVRSEGQRLEKQLKQQRLQAESAEINLQLIVGDLVALAQTNATAGALIEQLGITVAPGPAQGAASLPASSASPARP